LLTSAYLNKNQFFNEKPAHTTGIRGRVEWILISPDGCQLSNHTILIIHPNPGALCRVGSHNLSHYRPTFSFVNIRILLFSCAIAEPVVESAAKDLRLVWAGGRWPQRLKRSVL
jgi:hypothetical protein